MARVIHTDYIYDKNDIKMFIDYFGTDIISTPVAEIVELDLAGEISIDDSFYYEYFKDRVIAHSRLGTILAVEDRHDKSKYNWIEDNERISKIDDLSPRIHEMGITYFYSKEIDSFIDENKESQPLIHFLNQFNVIVSNTARDTLTHSRVKVIDRSSRIFPWDIQNKYAIICGFTSPGLDCTSRTMDISHSEFAPTDGVFLKSILNSIKNINEIIKK